MLTFGLMMATLSAAPRAQLDLAVAEWQRGNDAAARAILEKAMVEPMVETKILAQMHLYLGLTRRERASDEEVATQSFRAALALDSELELPEGVSPRVKKWWLRAGGKSSELKAIGVSIPKSNQTDLGKVAEPIQLTPAERAGQLNGVAGSSRLEVNKRRPWVIPASLGAASVATVIAAAVLGALAMSQAQSARNEIEGIGEATLVHRRATSMATAANVVYAVSGALALSAGISLIVVF